jgi:hypothetical protein
MHLQLCCTFRYCSYKSIYSELRVIQYPSAWATEKLALTGATTGLKDMAIPKRPGSQRSRKKPWKWGRHEARLTELLLIRSDGNVSQMPYAPMDQQELTKHLNQQEFQRKTYCFYSWSYLKNKGAKCVMQYFDQLPLATSPTVLPHGGTITIQARWISHCNTVYLKSFIHLSTMSPRMTLTWELKQKQVLTL